MDVNDTIRITNTTGQTQSLTLNGNVVATLDPGQSFTHMFNMKGKFVFGLASHQHAKLLVTVKAGHVG
jgi:hypothetical protein